MSLQRLLYLGLIILACYCGFYLYQQSWLPNAPQADSTKLPLFTGSNVSSTQYSTDGVRDYYITSQSFEHFADTENTNFNNPQLNVYQGGNVIEWVIDAKLAILNKDNELLLTGGVIAQNQLPNAAFKTMTTQSMTLNLDNKDFFSDKPVELKGPAFNNQGNSVKGNFNDNIATLSNKVQGTYDSVHK